MATKKKKKATKMSLNDFIQNTPGRVQRQAALPSAPTGLDRRRGGRGGGRGGYRGGGDRYGDRGGYGDREQERTRSDDADWRSGGRGGFRGGGGDRGGFGRDRDRRGGFGGGGRGGGGGYGDRDRDRDDRPGGDVSFDRSAFGSKKQSSSRGGFGGGGGFGRTNGGMRDRRDDGGDDRDMSRRAFGTAPVRPQRRDPPRDNRGGMESSRADEASEWRSRNPRRPPPERQRDPPAQRYDDNTPAPSRSMFGSRAPPPRREPRQRSPPRDRDRPGMGDSWRRKERREPDSGGWNSNRGNDRGGGPDRADQQDDWRSRDRPRPSSSGFGRSGGGSGFGRTGFGRSRDDDDVRGNFRDSPEPPKVQPPKTIQVQSTKFNWDSKPAKATVAPTEPAVPVRTTPRPAAGSQPTPRSKFLGSGSGMGAEIKQSTSRFGGSGKGFGVDILMNNEVTDSAEYHSQGTSFGRTRATFQAVGLQDDFPSKSLRGSGGAAPLSARPAAPAQEFPSLKPKGPVAGSAKNAALQRRLNRQAEEERKAERQREKEAKREERARKLKIKAERTEKLNAALTKGNKAFQKPLGMDVIRTGSMELAIPPSGRSRKDIIKNLAILLVNSIISEEKDHENATFPKVLKYVSGHKTFEAETKYSLLIAVLKQLNQRTSEYKALELVGNTLERIFEMLEVDPENPRDELEDLELSYLAPRVDVEALIHKCMEEFASATKTVDALNAGEGDAVSPELAERVVTYLWEQSFVKAASEPDPAKAFAEDVPAAFTELLKTVNPIQFLNVAVQAWFDKASNSDLKGMLEYLTTNEVLEKQSLLDYQHDVAPKRFTKSKRESLFVLTSWFSEIDLELNPPEEYSDEEEGSGSDDEDEEESS